MPRFTGSLPTDHFRSQRAGVLRLLTSWQAGKSVRSLQDRPSAEVPCQLLYKDSAVNFWRCHGGFLQKEGGEQPRAPKIQPLQENNPICLKPKSSL